MDKICLDLGCGTRKRKGHIGIDRFALSGVDILCDIEKGIPIKNDCVKEVYSNYFFEHVQNLVFVFQEVYRVCKNGARVELVVPYYTSINAFKDPTHQTFFTEETFKYFTQDRWYGSDYNIKTNFAMIDITYHYSKIALLLYPLRKYLRRHFLNMVGAMTVTMEVVK